ncbi:MAG: ABC transporter permease [Magnetococcales bacterium]|nr:ABC transporter permease [Magnetococcales bacterium]
MTSDNPPTQRRDSKIRLGEKLERFLAHHKLNHSGNVRKGRPGQPRLIDHSSYINNFHFRSIARAWRRFRGGSLSHWAATIVIALSLTIHGSFILFLTNADTAIQTWKGDNLVTVFLKKSAPVTQLTQIRSQLADQPLIQGLTIVSPDDAMVRMRRMLGSESALLNDLDDNPLPYSIEFHHLGDSLDQTAHLAREIGSWPGVETVAYDHEWAKKLAATFQFIRTIGLALLGLLLSAVALIIANTIKLTIIARRDEIEIMRFMGATHLFIKAPFIYEGIIQGLLGALGAIALVLALFEGTSHAATELSTAFGMHLELSFLSGPQLLLILLLGIGLGLAGALISLSRFLEV